MNQTMIQFFHWYSEGNGKLWKEAEKQAPYLSELGITSVWFPPAYKGTDGPNSVGYDAYDLFDLGEFDQKNSIPTKYGTKKDYINAINALHKKNISVIVDIVLGHKAGGDELETFKAAKVDENNREKIISEFTDIQSYTKFTFPGRDKKYSDFEWNFTCFSGVDYAEGKESHIYKIQSEYGNDWEEMIDDEKGNYDYLMFNDVEHRNPHVREEAHNSRNHPLVEVHLAL